MPDDGIEKSTSAPLISVRRSFHLHISSILVLGTGMWLVLGVFGLLEHIRLLAGARAAWAYLTAGLLMLPTLLSYAELRGKVGHSGGGYRLLRAIERPFLTFTAGWAFILGWAAAGAVVVRIFASYASRLIGLLTAWQINEPALVAAALLFFAATNILGLKPLWRTGVWLVGSAGLGVVALVGLLSARAMKQESLTLMGSQGGEAFFGAVLVLAACFWVVELVGEAGDRRRQTAGFGLTLLIVGPVLAAALALTGRLAAPTAMSLEEVAALASPQAGGAISLATGTLASGVVWQVLSLLMLRRFQVIGLDGWLPNWLVRPYTRAKTPVMLILFQGLLVPSAMFLASALTDLPGGATDAVVNLAYMAAIVLLLLYAGVNMAAVILANRSGKGLSPVRPLLYPAIPATGAAVNILLIFAAPWPIMVLALAWFGLGAFVYWRAGMTRIRTSRLGVTVFQDIKRHRDIASDYSVLVPVANPDTALELVAFGAAIAREHEGHVSIIQVVQVPEHLPLDSSRAEAQRKLDLLEQVLEQSEQFGVPVEGITRLARSIPQGILDTVTEENAEVVVMGWDARRIERAGRRLGHILDEVVENATCHVVVVRGAWGHKPRRVMVPVAGGPHAPFAAKLALELTAGCQGEVTLLHVVREGEEETELEAGHALVEAIRRELGEPDRVVPRVIRAASPLTGIISTVGNHDAIMLGASEMGFLDRRFFGSLPLQLASETDKFIALVRSYTGLTGFVTRKAWTSISDLLPTLTAEEQMEVYRRMGQAARPSANYFVLITLSAMIATLGLLLNSPAVIIGAMLVAPLMSPFIAEAVGIVFGDARIVRDSLTSIVQGMLVSVLIAVVMALASPLSEATTEVLARTRPNLLDLMVALVSGMAGAYAVARNEVGEALPGVAIAAALMPPLCTVGIGIALGDAAVALGALLLFTTNLVAIVFASAVVFLLLGIHPPRHPERQRWLRQGLLITVISLVVISIPLGVVLFQTVERDRIESHAQAIVHQAVADLEPAELVNFSVEVTWRRVTVSGTLYTSRDISDLDIEALDRALEEQLRRPVHIRLFAVQGTTLDSSATKPE